MSVLLMYSCSNLRPPAVGSRHHPLRVDEGASTEMGVAVQEGGLIFDGVRVYQCTPNYSVPICT